MVQEPIDLFPIEPLCDIVICRWCCNSMLVVVSRYKLLFILLLLLSICANAKLLYFHLWPSSYLLNFWLQVVMAMKSEGGQQAVFETLHRARELYRSRLQANAAADELASLFAECAIAEAKPAASNPPPSNMVRASLHLQESADNSILAMSGRKQIMLDAFADGSSFICLQCGGLVSNLRKDEHQAYWCD